jgi:peptidoglycan/LPS O-acetylase OafA/YrhL
MNKNKTVYFSGLNGLRAIAALSVVVHHITLALKEFNLDPYIFGAIKDGSPRGLSLGGFGVTIFFVLSGFLITYLLQTEKELSDINIKKFYIRRILRIWPLYYLYLAIAVIVIIIFGFNLNLKSLFLYIFYAANIPFILGKDLPFLAHYWSLGVEEQFYLFWPWVNKKSGSLLTFILIFIIVLFGSKVILHLFYPNSLLESVIHVTRFHCMMIGGAGAVLYKRENKLFLTVTDNKLTQLLCWSILFLTAVNKYHLASFIDNEIIACVSLCLIIGQIRVNNRVINLETKVFDFLGRISYGIYVTHLLLIFFIAKLLNLVTIYGPLKYIMVYVVVLSTTIIFSYLSYNYIEKYFLNFKKKFEVVKSSSTKNFT